MSTPCQITIYYCLKLQFFVSDHQCFHFTTSHFTAMSPGHASKKSLVEICKEHKERGTGDLEGK
ncbi:hypothetical protein F7725_004029 [Dissostichus mawsoni]|uniref:Uncharacterized protein n=1 Tax=Dissostichus mawsoni TaxID=36200 RepID=A0A7J5YD68_DISMA|nr:hypothetical protein F7725_004029 [Dissostichus mawsoni]